MTLTIAPGEAGLIRVFALSMTAREAKELDKLAALGLTEGDVDYIEVFPTKNLEGLGLAEYLVEGLGALEGEVKADKGKLGALGGWVMVVQSKAFSGPGPLSPQPALTLIGVYGQEGVDFTPVTVTSEAAELYSAPQKKTMSEARISGMVATVVLLFLALFVVMFVLIGG